MLDAFPMKKWEAPFGIQLPCWYTVLRIRLKTPSDQHLTSSGPGQVQQLAAYLSKMTNDFSRLRF